MSQPDERPSMWSVPWGPDDGEPAQVFVKGFSEQEWQEIWAVLQPHEGFPLGEAAFRREVERAEGAYDAELVSVMHDQFVPHNVRELQAFIDALRHVLGCLERHYPFFVPIFGSDPLLNDLRTILADAESDCSEKRRLKPPPRRHSREIDAYWRALLASWERVLGREVRQTQQLIHFLVLAGRSMAGRSSATPDAARRFIRAELAARKKAQAKSAA